MAGNNDFNIQVGIELDNNGQQLLTEWKTIKEKIEKDGLNLDFGKSIQDNLKQITQIGSEISNLQKQINSLNNNKINISVNNLVNGLKKTISTTEELRSNLSSFGKVTINSNDIDQTNNKMKQLTATVDIAGQKIKLLYNAIRQPNEKDGELKIIGYEFNRVKSITDNTDKVLRKSTEQEAKNREKIQQVISSTMQKREEESRVLQQNQANAINRALEQEAKERDLINQKISETIQKREEEIRKEAELQAKYSNKALDETYSQQQKSENKKSQLISSFGTNLGDNSGLNLDSNITEVEKYLKTISNGNVQLNQFGEVIEQNGVKFRQFHYMVDEGNNRFSRYTGTITDLNNNFHLLGKGIVDTTSKHKSFAEVMKSATESIMGFSIISGAYFTAISAIKESISYIIELNKQLTEISIVTNKSQNEVRELGFEYANLAKQLSVSTSEVASAAVEFYRQGLSQSEVMERLKTTTEYAKISNLDFNESAKILTATVNSMGVDINKASDVFAYMGDATATGADEIGKAFQRVGGTASALGVDFNKVSSWIATISSKTREGAESIGNGIKSIMARYTQLKEKGFAEEDGTKVNNVAKALSTVGIQMIDSRGQFVEFGSVMDQLGAKWQGMDSRTKAYISTQMAGTYQMSRFQNLMNGYADSVDLYNKSLEASGTTQQKYNKWMDGLEAHINKLKLSWTDMSQSLIDSEGLKGVVDTLTLASNGVGGLVKNVGLIPSIIAVASTALLTFNKNMQIFSASSGNIGFSTNTQNIFSGLKNGLESYTKTYSKHINELQLLNNTYNQTPSMLIKANASMKALSDSTLAQTLASGTLRVATIALNAAMGMFIGFVVGEAIQGISHWINKTNEMAEANKELLSSTQDSIEGHRSNIQQLEQMKQQYNEIETRINSMRANGLQPTIEDQNKLNDINEKIAKMMPNLVEGYDSQGKAILNLKKGYDGLIESEKQAMKNDALKMVAKGDDFKDVADSKIKNIKDKLNGSNSYDGTAKFWSNTPIIGQIMSDYAEFTGKTKLTKDQIALLNKELEEQQGWYKQLIPQILITNDTYGQLDPSLQKLVLDYANIPKIFEGLSTDQIKAKIGLIVDLFNNADAKPFIKQIEDLQVSAKSGQIPLDEYTKKLADLLIKLASVNGIKISKEDLQKIFDFDTSSMGNNIDGAIEKIKSLSDIQKDFAKSVSETRKEILPINQALKDHAETGEWNMDTILKLAEEYPDLLSKMDDDKALEEELTKIKNDKIQATKSELKTEIDVLTKKIEGYKIDVSKYQTAEEMKTAILKTQVAERLNILKKEMDEMNINDLMKDKTITRKDGSTYFQKGMTRSEAEEKYARGQMRLGDLYGMEYNKIMSPVDELFKAKDLEKQFDITLNQVSDDLKKNSSATKENKEQQEALANAIKKVKNEMKSYENAIKAVDNAIYNLDSQMQGMNKTSDEYINALQKENDMFRQRISLVDNATKANNSYINSIGSMGGVGGSALGQQIVAGAEQYLGTPYAWGGTSPQGFDCSGLVQYVYDQVGVSLNRTSQEQFKQGTPVSKSDLQPGDLVFFKSSGSASAPGHVAIYAGGGQIVESPRSGASVRMADLENRSDFVGARRIVSGGSSGNSDGVITMSADSLNSVLKGALSGQGEAFVKYGQKYGVDPALVASIAMHETGNGTSYAVKNQNNPAGVMDWNNNWKTVKTFDSLDEGIEFAIKNLKETYIDKGLTSISQIGDKYAPVGASNDPNGLNKNWIPSVTKFYNQMGGEEKLFDTANGEIENIISKTQDYAKQNIDFTRKILENNTKIYEAYLGRFDEQYNHVGKNQELAKEKYALYKDTPSMKEESNAQAEQVWKEINWKNTVLVNKENYIRSEMQKNIYDQATLQKMSLDLEQTKLDILKNTNELHQYFNEWIQETYNNEIKTQKSNIEDLERKLNILDKLSTKNYDDKISLNDRILNQNEQIKQKTLEQIDALQKLIDLEKEDTTREIWIDQQNKLLDQLDEINAKTLDIQQKNIELAKNKAFDAIEKQIYDGKTQEQYENNIKKQINALDDELEVMQKQNDALQERETRQKNLLDIAEAQIKLQEAQNNKNVQQLTKDKNGNWNFTYVANQQNVDSAESELRNRLKSNSDWEKQNTDKHKQDSLNDQKKALQDEINIRKEALDSIKRNIEIALQDQNNLFANGGANLNNIVNDSLSQLNSLYNGKFSGIVSTVRSAVNQISSSILDMNSQIANSQTIIEDINNTTAQGKNNTVWVTKLDSPDGETAKKYYSSLGYNIQEINKDNVSKANSGDVLLGLAGTLYGDQVGNGVRKVTGVDKDDTTKKAQKDALELQEKAGRESVEIEEKYSNQSTQIKQNANNRNTIIVKNATTGETMTIQKGANTNMNIIRQSWDGIVNMTYDKMGNMVVTVKGKVEEASAELRNLIALQEQAGLSSGGSRSQENHVKVMPGVDPHAPTTSIYIKDGITYYYDSQHPLKFDTGGETGDWGTGDGKIAMLHKKERVLSARQTEAFSDLVFKQLPELQNIIPNLSSLISNIQLPKISLPDFNSIFNKNSQQLATNNNIHLDNITLNCPNVVDGKSFVEALKNLPNTITQTVNNIYNK